MSKTINRLESIKFDNNVIEDRKINSDNTQNKSPEHNFKKEENNKIINVNIFQLLKSYRFVMNCIHALLTSALFVLMLQLIVPYLCAHPYDLTLGDASQVIL